MSRDTTFEEDTSDVNLILETLGSLAEEVHKQLVESNFTCKTVTVKIRTKTLKRILTARLYRF